MCVCVVHWHCTAQLSMFNMEKRNRNKIIIIIIVITVILCDCSTGRRKTPTVDREIAEPCENPDTYQYILHYHCGGDMASSVSQPDDYSSSSDKTLSGRPDPSSAHTQPSSSYGKTDSWRPTPSSTMAKPSHHMSGAEQSPSGSLSPSRTQPGQVMPSSSHIGPDRHNNTPPPPPVDPCM